MGTGICKNKTKVVTEEVICIPNLFEHEFSKRYDLQKTSSTIVENIVHEFPSNIEGLSRKT